MVSLATLTNESSFDESGIDTEPSALTPSEAELLVFFSA